MNFKILFIDLSSNDDFNIMESFGKKVLMKWNSNEIE